MIQKRPNKDPWSEFSFPSRIVTVVIFFCIPLLYTSPRLSHLFESETTLRGCVVVPHPSLHLFEGGYPSTLMNSFCTDEVSSSLARCEQLKSDGEILVNDELRGDTSFSLRLLWIISSACIMRSMQKRVASAVATKILQL